MSTREQWLDRMSNKYLHKIEPSTLYLLLLPSLFPPVVIGPLALRTAGRSLYLGPTSSLPLGASALPFHAAYSDHPPRAQDSLVWVLKAASAGLTCSSSDGNHHPCRFTQGSCLVFAPGWHTWRTQALHPPEPMGPPLHQAGPCPCLLKY